MTAVQPHDRLWALGAARQLLRSPVGQHLIGSMDPHDPERFRLSAAAERRAARAWVVAAARAHSCAEVLACTQLGRTALRQARAYDELVAELAVSA